MPLGLNATPVHSSRRCWSGRPSGWREATSHSRTVASSPPLASSVAVRAERHVHDGPVVTAERRPEPSPGGDVPERDRPVVGGAGERPSVRADRDALQAASVLERAADPAIGGQRGQHGEDGAASLHRRLAAVGLERQQAAERDVVPQPGQRAGREAARVRGALFGALALDGVDGDGGRDGGDHDQHGHGRGDAPAPADSCGLLGAAAGVQERALGAVEVWLVAGSPFQRGRQARSAVEVAGVPARLVPVACGGGEPAVQTPSLGVLFQPPAQARPLAQQRFVGELHGAGADREQALVREHADHLGDLVVERGQRDPAALDRAARVFRGQPQQHAAGDGLLRRIELGEGLLGMPRD